MSYRGGSILERNAELPMLLEILNISIYSRVKTRLLEKVVEVSQKIMDCPP